MQRMETWTYLSEIDAKEVGLLEVAEVVEDREK